MTGDWLPAAPPEVAQPDPATIAGNIAAELAGITAQFGRPGREFTRSDDGTWRCHDDGKLTAGGDSMGDLWLKLRALEGGQ